MVGRLIRNVVLVVALAIAVLAGWLAISPPELLRVGTGYAAKIVCSNVFVAGRGPEEVLQVDVQAPGHPLLKLVNVDVGSSPDRVEASMLGFIAPSVAVYREGLGCANVPDGDLEAATAVTGLPAVSPLANPDAIWPEGNRVEAADPRLANILTDEALLGPGARAVVVVKDGRIVGEAYGEGFSALTPLLGWSMTKTVNAALVGRMIAEGRIGLLDSGLFPAWKGDDREAITVKALIAMEDGLAFNEDYGDVADVTRMLYLEPDMAGFAASRPLDKAPGTQFNYSSGTAVLISRLWMERIGDPVTALAYPRAALFEPLGMTSAVFETDARGTFVGSSYLYATARDWVRFGAFLVQGGVWEGKRLLSEEFVASVFTPTPVSNNAYTQAQAWKAGPGGGTNEELGLPANLGWLRGHDGQTMAVIPSENLVVLRLGLTPQKLGYRPQLLVKAVADALR